MPFARSSSRQRSKSRGPSRGVGISLERGPQLPLNGKSRPENRPAAHLAGTLRAAQGVSSNAVTLSPRAGCRRSW